jgi:hypothetical protein
MLAGAIKTLVGEVAAAGTTTTVMTTHHRHILRAHHEGRLHRHSAAAAGLRIHHNGSLAFGVARPPEPQRAPQQATQQVADPLVRLDNLPVGRVGSATAAAASRPLVGATWRDPAAAGMNRQVLEARGGVEEIDIWNAGKVSL